MGLMYYMNFPGTFRKHCLNIFIQSVFSYSEHFEQNVVYINIEVSTCKNFLNICCKPFSCHIKKKQL